MTPRTSVNVQVCLQSLVTSGRSNSRHIFRDYFEQSSPTLKHARLLFTHFTTELLKELSFHIYITSGENDKGKQIREMEGSNE